MARQAMEPNDRMKTAGGIFLAALAGLLLLACTSPADARGGRTGPQTGQISPSSGPAGTVFQGLARGYRTNQSVWIGLMRTDDPQRRERPLVWADLVYADSSGTVRFSVPLPDFLPPGAYAATVSPEDGSARELRLPFTFERSPTGREPKRGSPLSVGSDAALTTEQGRSLRFGDSIVPASGPAGASFIVTAGDFLPGERVRVHLLDLRSRGSGSAAAYPLGATQADERGVVGFAVPPTLDYLPDGQYATLLASVRDPARQVRLRFSVGTGEHELGLSGEYSADSSALLPTTNRGPASGPGRLVVGTAAAAGALLLDLVHGQGIESYRGVLSVEGVTTQGEQVVRNRVGVMGFTTESLPYGRYTIAYEATYARVSVDGERREVHIPRQETTAALGPDAAESRWEPSIR